MHRKLNKFNNNANNGKINIVKLNNKLNKFLNYILKLKIHN